MKKLRVVFLGTPEFAVPSLRTLMADDAVLVAGVMTQPDRPAGRGQKLQPPPVKVEAMEMKLPVMQPARLRNEPEMISWLNAMEPDFLVTAAFGQILSQEVLDIPKYGTVNVHASLLPKYRGPNPVQWAILNGDAKTGITIMLTDIGVDTGAMLLKAETDIEPDEDAAILTRRLADIGAMILPKTLVRFATGEIHPTPQEESQATHAPKLHKSDAFIDWTKPAQQIHDKVRGQQPWPGTVACLSEGIQLKIVRTRSPKLWPDSEEFMKNGKPGEILDIIKVGLVVQTGSGPLLVETVQPAGKPKMSAHDWANGILKNTACRRFETQEEVEVV